MQAHGVRVEVVEADLVDLHARQHVIDHIARCGLSIDLLVNNAGLSTSGPVHAGDRAAELRMVQTNVEAVADLCNLALGPMVRRGAGAVLNVASVAAFQPLPGQAGYGASKAFVLSYSQALRGELRRTGVTVTVLCPGPVATGFGEVAGLPNDELARWLPPFLWVAPDEVAEAGLRGVERGRATVIPGASNRAMVASSAVTPWRVAVALLGRSHPALRGRQGS